MIYARLHVPSLIDAGLAISVIPGFPPAEGRVPEGAPLAELAGFARSAFPGLSRIPLVLLLADPPIYSRLLILITH